jgi:hypothetical protein
MKQNLQHIAKEKISIIHKTGLLLVSMSALVLEFSLIRVLSVSLWYHFAFMIISIALLGFGISGVAIIISSRINKSEINFFITVASLLYAASILLSFSIINVIPFEPFSLLVDTSQFFYLPLYYLTITLPFFFAGLIIGKLFISFNKSIPSLYFFDLVGAGLSCIVFVIVLPAFGGSGGVIFASLLATLASLLFCFKGSKMKFIGPIGAIVLLIVNGMFLSAPEAYLPIRISPNKLLGNYVIDNPKLKMVTKWNTFSKVDVMKDDDAPVDDYPVYIAVLDGGNASTNIPNVPSINDTMRPPYDASNLAMVLKKEDTAKVFVLGSGGGSEILTALTFKPKSVTAVEINPILNDLIKKDYASYWTTGIVKDKRVNIITDDARSWLKGKRIVYDVIISAHTISASATNSGAMSLVENYVLTEEAIRDYLHHLDINGVLYITRPEGQIPRLVTTIRIAQQKNGGSDLKNQFYIFKKPPSPYEKDVSYLTGVMFKKTGFDEYEIQLLKTICALLNLETVYDPVSKQDGIYKNLVEQDDIYETIKQYPVNLSPATDDNPYFEHQVKFTDLNLSQVKESFSQTERAIITLANKPAAESTLVILLIQAVLIAALLIFLPIYLKFRKKENVIKNKYSVISYFALLGLGYIMIEICMIQKFTLLLGQPVYTLLTVICSMLIFSGIGSMFSEKVIKLFRDKIYILFGIIFILTTAIALLNPLIFDALSRSDLSMKIIISVLMIAPLAFFMGIPFPYGMGKIDQNSKILIAFGWGVNGFFSVLGSILVVMLTMSYGFRVVFITAAVIYLIAMLVSKKLAIKLN